MKLWLDDIRPAPAGWTWVKTAWDAMEILGKGQVVQVSLDHDLGEPEHGTGYNVARFIEAEAFHGRIPRLVWAVHSANPTGAERMKIALERADGFWEGRT